MTTTMIFPMNVKLTVMATKIQTITTLMSVSHKIATKTAFQMSVISKVEIPLIAIATPSQTSAN